VVGSFPRLFEEAFSTVISQGAEGPSELAAFHADYSEILAQFAAHDGNLELPGQLDGDFLAVVGDNFVSIMNLAHALGLLMEKRNQEGTLVIFRSLYESVINLMYLYDVGDRKRNALLARAFTAREMSKYYAEIGDPATAEEIADEEQAVYRRMPDELRKELEERLKLVRNHWSGVTIAQRAKAVGFVGHHQMYKGASWEVHTSAVGRLVWKRKASGKHEIVLNRSLSDADAEGCARLARQLLRQAFRRFSDAYFGAPIKLSSPPPKDLKKA